MRPEFPRYAIRDGTDELAATLSDVRFPNARCRHFVARHAGYNATFTTGQWGACEHINSTQLVVAGPNRRRCRSIPAIRHCRERYAAGTPDAHAEARRHIRGLRSARRYRRRTWKLRRTVLSRHPDLVAVS